MFLCAHTEQTTQGINQEVENVLVDTHVRTWVAIDNLKAVLMQSPSAVRQSLLQACMI